MINVIFLASISSYYIYDHFGELKKNLIFSPTPEFIFLVSIKIMYFEALGKDP